MKVFLSSTFRDLGPEREAMLLAFRRRRQTVIAMEDFLAGLAPTLDTALEHLREGKPYLSIDSVADFRELTQLKIESGVTGLIMLGGGVPKNSVQDTVVSAEYLGYQAEMHKYAVQLTVANERDGALSGATLKEAHTWGKVELEKKQMVYGEATVTFPLIAGYAYHKGSWRDR